ncbi:hypothetical protein M8J75_003387 [Diaphorina citri]|nr:hypothetical protein M8J75_003387 [Diaphorina citri]
MKCLIVLCVLPCLILGASVYDARENLIEEGRSDSADVGGTTWKILNKVMADCNNDDFSKITSCLGQPTIQHESHHTSPRPASVKI